MPRFQNGDTVVLKSGGPTMTVQTTIQNSTKVRCDWYEGKMKQHIFEEATLELAAPLSEALDQLQAVLIHVGVPDDARAKIQLAHDDIKNFMGRR